MGWNKQGRYSEGYAGVAGGAEGGWGLVRSALDGEHRLRYGKEPGCAADGGLAGLRSGLQARDKVAAESSAGRRLVVGADARSGVPAFVRRGFPACARSMDLERSHELGGDGAYACVAGCE